jgi:TonB family protein
MPTLTDNTIQPPETLILPANKLLSEGASRLDCENWHRNAPHGVTLSYSIEQDGSMKNISVLSSSGDPEIDKDAATCIMKWRFKPAMLNGRTIGVRVATGLYDDPDR